MIANLDPKKKQTDLYQANLRWTESKRKFKFINNMNQKLKNTVNKA